jgi:methionyl-tRNA formyltransferase
MISMRLIMLGTGPFAVPTLRGLAASRHEIALAVTRPPTGRDRTASPIQQAGESLGLTVWSPESVNLPESQARLSAIAADLLVVCDYGEILRPQTLGAARLGGINLHGSLLPKYRGAAPVQWAILRGESETGNSVIQMTPGLDAGPLLAQQRTPIDADENAGQLEARLATMGAELVLQVVEQLESGTTQPLEQDSTQSSKAPRLKKEQGAIDWSRPAQEIKNQVRALRPWPRAFTYWRRTTATPIRVSIDRVRVRSDLGAPTAVPWPEPWPNADHSATFDPGMIFETRDHLLVAAGDDFVEVREIQPAGKRSMSAAEFLRGYHGSPGDHFGPV